VVKHLLSAIYTPFNFRYWVQEHQKTILVEKDEGVIIGFAVIDNPYGGVSLLRWLGVVHDKQRHGVGTALIAAWESLAKIQLAHKMEVAAQPEAKKFYEKVGLNLEGKREKSYFGIDQFIFGKVIGAPREDVMTKS
jgi:GNAT superfamily N-acetyltransferase